MPMTHAEVAAEGDGYHKHQCAFCGFVWEHHNSNDRRHGSEGAHECPTCGRCNWSLGIYEGHLPPQVRSPIMPQERMTADEHTPARDSLDDLSDR